MKSQIKLFLFFLFIAASTQAQDIIIKKNGDELRCKVLEISTTQITFQSKSNRDSLAFDTLQLNKDEVFMIRYQNGSKDVFTVQEEEKAFVPFEKQEPVLSEKIEVQGRRFYYHNRKIGISKVMHILHGEHNREINNKLSKSVVCSVFSPILKFASIPVGVVGFIFLGIESNSNLSSSDFPNDNSAEICISTFLLAQAGGYTVEYFQYKNLKDAIKLYNAKH